MKTTYIKELVHEVLSKLNFELIRIKYYNSSDIKDEMYLEFNAYNTSIGAELSKDSIVICNYDLESTDGDSYYLFEYTCGILSIYDEGDPELVDSYSIKSLINKFNPEITTKYGFDYNDVVKLDILVNGILTFK